MKIKFPFFSKKFPWVCTTEQVVHQVDGKDKKLSEVLSGGPCVTINGKDPLDYGEYSVSMSEIAANTVSIFNRLGMPYLYIFSPIDITFELTSPQSADVNIKTKDFMFLTDYSVETDAETEEKRVVFGEGVYRVFDERYENLDLRGILDTIHEDLQSMDIEVFEDVIACFIDDYDFE